MEYLASECKDRYFESPYFKNNIKFCFKNFFSFVWPQCYSIPVIVLLAVNCLYFSSLLMILSWLAWYQMVISLHTDLGHLVSWCEANNLKMNVQKIEELVIGYGLKYTQLLPLVSKYLNICWNSHLRRLQQLSRKPDSVDKTDQEIWAMLLVQFYAAIKRTFVTSSFCVCKTANPEEEYTV